MQHWMWKRMLFTTLQFIGFVGLCVAVYYIAPLKTRWVVLLLGSTLFYTLLVKRRVVFVLFSCVSTWLAGVALGELRRRAKPGQPGMGARRAKLYSRLVLLAFLLANIGLLVVAKFVLAQGGLAWMSGLGLLMPIGMSFYTLQVAGYVIDVYNGKVQPEKNLFKVALFTTFFPQVIQGPISRFKQLEPQLVAGHALQYNNLVLGAQRMLWGYFKKLVIADRLAMFTRTVYAGYEEYTGFVVLAGAVCYTVQLYADFSGGIDIALGVGRLFGIQMPENFIRPFFSKSVAEFWRRWHITLGTWLRDYVYYPLNFSLTRRLMGRRRLEKWLPLYLSLLVTWLLNGLWHGEGLQYICSGLWYGGLIMLGTAAQAPAQRFFAAAHIGQQAMGLKLLRMARTFACVVIAQIMFGSSSVAMMVGLLKGLFSSFNPGVLVDGTLLHLGLDAADWAVALAGVALLFLVSFFSRRRDLSAWLNSRRLPLRWGILLAGLACIAVFGIYGPAYDPTPFIYFQF